MKCKDCESKWCPYRNTFNNGICVYNPEKPTTFDWQSFRTEAAKDILCAMIPERHNIIGPNNVEYAIMIADELIKQLKEKEN